MKLVTLLCTLVAVLLLSGCGTLDKTFDNRLTCTVSKDKAYVISLYGPIGISAELNAEDSKTVCTKEPTK